MDAEIDVEAVSKRVMAERVVQLETKVSFLERKLLEAEQKPTMEAITVQLRLRLVALLHFGEADRQTLLNQLEDAFGPEVASGLGIHLFDLNQLSLPAEQIEELRQKLRSLVS